MDTRLVKQQEVVAAAVNWYRTRKAPRIVEIEADKRLRKALEALKAE